MPPVRGDGGLRTGRHPTVHGLGGSVDGAGHLHERIRRDQRAFPWLASTPNGPGSNTVGWIYWAWKYYDDPTGSSAEGLVLPNGTYTPIVTVLSRTYPQEVAGVANAVLFNPFTSAFSMAYTPSVSAHGQTVIEVAASQHYPNGWCAAVKGGKIVSSPGATHLRVQRVGTPAEVYVSVTPGACPS